METRTVADIEGDWVDGDFESSLITRCRASWYVPVGELSNQMLATFLRQGIAINIVLAEAKRRLDINYVDETELYDEELEVAVKKISQSGAPL